MATNPTVDQMRAELAAKSAPAPTRLKFEAEGPRGVNGIIVPRHMWEGNEGVYQKGAQAGKPFKAEGMKDINKARAAVYGSENREPLDIQKVGRVHQATMAEHFAKPLKEQILAEKAALAKLREAKHINSTANTLDESEKLDTVRHEYDEQGRPHVGFASKGVAGHALYTSGEGASQKHHVINTCPGQTVGCGGGADKSGYIDTSKGTCFAPNAEQQYVGAAVRRAAHEQAKHDPAMTRDWILAHTGSLRGAANTADKNNERLLFRPNVVDETDVSSRHAIRHLNEQRKAEGKPPIIANSYGKTNELHDPENGYYVTHSNVGPKTKKGQSIEENISRDKARVRNTSLATDSQGKDFKNEQGNQTPPKNSYMVTDVKRGSPMASKMEGAITHAKYWSTGLPNEYLTPTEKAEGPEGHFGANGEPTSPEAAHYGHTTVANEKNIPLRFDYQKQHILHPRLVNVPQMKKNKKTGEMERVNHLIPTDSRFKDEEFLPKNRFMSPTGKKAGALLMTTPTESTSNVGHQTSFTHHVGPSHIEHALANNGEYEIDAPREQIKSAGKEYTTPQEIKFQPKTFAQGGSVGDSEANRGGLSDDDFHAFPEQNGHAQRHLSMRVGSDEQVHRKAHTAAAPRGPANQDEMLAHTILHKAIGGAVQPDDAAGESTDVGYYEGGPSDGAGLDPMQYKAAGGAIRPSGPTHIGVDEAPAMPVKLYMPPDGHKGGMPVGGVDFQPEQPGQQMMPGQGGAPMPPPGGPQGPAPQGGLPAPGGPAPIGSPPGPQSNILQMTPQGQAMSAMRATPPTAMKKGGKVELTTAQMRMALRNKKASGGFEGSKISDIGMTERPL